MKINDIIQETTSAGGIATVAVPLGGMQKRPNASVFANTTPKKKKKKATENTKDEQLPNCKLCKGKGCDACDNTGEEDGYIHREGKSPHKKGTAKYKKHMAAMHAEATLQTGGYGKSRKPRHTATV
jgi:hypothetical protein